MPSVINQQDKTFYTFYSYVFILSVFILCFSINAIIHSHSSKHETSVLKAEILVIDANVNNSIQYVKTPYTKSNVTINPSYTKNNFIITSQGVLLLIFTRIASLHIRLSCHIIFLNSEIYLACLFLDLMKFCWCQIVFFFFFC